MINIALDFYVIECDEKHLNECTNTICKECGVSLDDVCLSSDPFLESRKVLLENVLLTITQGEKEYKELKRDLRKGLLEKISYENEMDIISEYISTLSNKLSFEIFTSIDMTQKSVESIETIEKVREINRFFEELYNLLGRISLYEPSKVFRNVYKRLLLSIISFKESAVELIMSTVALNLDDANQLKESSQNKLDNAANEIGLLGSIFGVRNIENITELFQNGEMNYSAILSMVWQTSSEGTIEDRLINVCQKTRYYFRSILSKDEEYYSNDDLINLSIYRHVGIIAFDDESFLRKVAIAYNLYEKAFVKDDILVKDFLERYSNKYRYMFSKLSELSIAMAFVFGNNPSDQVLMNNALKWYKDLCEGIYRDSMTFLMLASNIEREKPSDIEELINWTGFGNICGQFSSLNKLKLNYFVEGVDSIIRHSEAHVDYDIDITNKKVVLRNKQQKSKSISTKEYEFDEFFEQLNLLSETVYSSIAAFTAFLINFKDKIENVDAFFEKKDEKEQILGFYSLLGLFGIIIDSENNFDNTTLEISGRFMGEAETFSFESISAIFVPLVQAKPYITNVKLEVSDRDAIKIGYIQVRTDYMLNSLNESGIKKDCWILMYMLTTKIESVFNITSAEDESKDNRFLTGIHKLIYPVWKDIVDEKNRTFRTGQANQLVFGAIMDKTKFIEMIIDEYIVHSDEKWLIEYVKSIFNNTSKALYEIMNYGTSLNKQLDKSFIVISKEMLNVGHCFDYLSGKISSKELFINYTEAGNRMYKNVKVNEPCPCGSGNKYKKCCRKYELMK